MGSDIENLDEPPEDVPLMDAGDEDPVPGTTEWQEIQRRKHREKVEEDRNAARERYRDLQILYVKSDLGLEKAFQVSPGLINEQWNNVFQSWPNLQQDLDTAGVTLQALRLDLKDFRVGDQHNIYVEAHVRNRNTGFSRVKPDEAWLHEEFKSMALEYLTYANPARRGSEPPTRYVADANDAELAAAEFMRWLGFLDAQASPVGPDGGVDVSSKRAVGQVKDYGKPIGRPELQQHLGVAVGEGGKLPVFFARSGYTNQALEWANDRDMPLYEFDLAGSWAPSNTAGELLWSAGADRFLKNRGLSGGQSPPQDTGGPPIRPRLEGQGMAGSQDVASDDSEPQEEPAISSEESGAGLAAEIRALGDLRDSGVLDDEEFRLAKKKLLD